LLRALTPVHASPAECLSRVSDLLLGDNEHQMEVQAFLGILDLRDGLLLVACASYPAPLLAVRPGDVRQIACTVAPPLAVRPALKLEDAVTELPERSTLLVFGPGAQRQQVADRSLGVDGVTQLVADYDDLDADAVADRLLLRFDAPGTTRTGDVSFVVVRYKARAVGRAVAQ
jgi:hypothetical protein